jgi:hypothetical protein
LEIRNFNGIWSWIENLLRSVEIATDTAVVGTKVVHAGFSVSHCAYTLDSRSPKHINGTTSISTRTVVFKLPKRWPRSGSSGVLMNRILCPFQAADAAPFAKPPLDGAKAAIQ